MSQPLADWLAEQGARASVARAYILAGIVAAGHDVTPFAGDVRRVCAEDIPPTLRAVLLAALDGTGCSTGVVHPYYTASDEAEPRLEPALSFDIGFDV